MKERLSEEAIAMRAAKELKPGDYCNLGGGIPLLCGAYVREGITFQGENGILGYGELITTENWQLFDFGRVDATGHFCLPKAGECVFDFRHPFAELNLSPGIHRLVTIPIQAEFPELEELG